MECDDLDAVSLREQLAAARRQLEAARSDNERLEGLVMPLEQVRHEQKRLLLAAKRALLDAKDVGVAQKKQPESQVPIWAASNSWEKTDQVPWNEAEGKILEPGEGIAFLALLLKVERTKVAQLQETQEKAVAAATAKVAAAAGAAMAAAASTIASSMTTMTTTHEEPGASGGTPMSIA